MPNLQEIFDEYEDLLEFFEQVKGKPFYYKPNSHILEPKHLSASHSIKPGLICLYFLDTNTGQTEKISYRQFRDLHTPSQASKEDTKLELE